MKTSALKKQSPVLIIDHSRVVQVQWLEAITNFYKSYHQLATYISGIEQELPAGQIAYISQCPVSHLMKLVSCMQTELANLTQAMDQVDSLKPTTTKTICDQLANHTVRLNQLTDQAQTRLYLIKRSA